MKKLILVTMLGIVAAQKTYAAESPESDTFRRYVNQIDQIEFDYTDVLSDLLRRRITEASFTTQVSLILDRLYDILTDNALRDEILRDRTFNVISRIIKRLERDNLVTQPIADRFITVTENQIIPGEFLERSKDTLSLLINELANHFKKQRNFDQALRFINLIKTVNRETPVSPRHIQATYMIQFDIAENYLEGRGTEKDLNKAQRLLVEIINQDSPAPLNIVKKSLDDLLRIFFEKLEHDVPEQELDDINDILEHIVLGTFRSTEAYLDKVLSNQMNVAMRYASTSINNKEKARHILLGIIQLQKAPAKIKRTALNLLNNI